MKSILAILIGILFVSASPSAGGAETVRTPARSKQAIPDLLDLSAYYTSTLDGANLGTLPQGVQAFSRAAFDVRGMIQLAGAQPEKGRAAVEGIVVDRKAEKIDFLQGAIGSALDDIQVGAYLLHYETGETRRIPLIYGRNVTNSFAVPMQITTDAAVVLAGKSARVFKYTANNPLPGVAIKTIDFVSMKTSAAPFLIAITIEPPQTARTYEWFDAIHPWNPIALRDSAATFDQVDLSRFYGASLNDDWFDHPGHDLQDVPQGLQTFGGMQFDVRGLIVLAGTQSLAVSGLALPEAVRDIPVGRKGKAVHFLQASAFVGTERGLKIGEYAFHYENGETKTADLIYGENELDWWVNPAEGHVTKADEVWFGSNPATRARGMRTRLLQFTWTNPLPDVTIRSIDFTSTLTTSSPMLVAITVEPARN
jgi:hypothetical protein